MPTVFVGPQEKYIRSYWETLGEICREGIYLALSEPFPYNVTVDFIRKIIADKTPAVFVIDTETDKCVGWCDAVSYDGLTGNLGMGILKSYRNKGIGSKLLELIKIRCGEKGYKKIELRVWKSNNRAIHLYEKSGFIKTAMDNDKIYMSYNLLN